MCSWAVAYLLTDPILKASAPSAVVGGVFVLYASAFWTFCALNSIFTFLFLYLYSCAAPFTLPHLTKITLRGGQMTARNRARHFLCYRKQIIGTLKLWTENSGLKKGRIKYILGCCWNIFFLRSCLAVFLWKTYLMKKSEIIQSASRLEIILEVGKYIGNI